MRTGFLLRVTSRTTPERGERERRERHDPRIPGRARQLHAADQHAVDVDPHPAVPGARPDDQRQRPRPGHAGVSAALRTVAAGVGPRYAAGAALRFQRPAARDQPPVVHRHGEHRGAGVGSSAPPGSPAATVNRCVPADSPAARRTRRSRAGSRRRGGTRKVAAGLRRGVPHRRRLREQPAGGTEVSVVSGGVGAGGPGAVTTTAACEARPPAHSPAEGQRDLVGRGRRTPAGRRSARTRVAQRVTGTSAHSTSPVAVSVNVTVAELSSPARRRAPRRRSRTAGLDGVGTALRRRPTSGRRTSAVRRLGGHHDAAVDALVVTPSATSRWTG